MSLYSLLDLKLSSEKSENSNQSAFAFIFFFPLVVCNIFSLLLTFNNLTVICVGEGCLAFRELGVLLASWTSKFNSFN